MRRFAATLVLAVLFGLFHGCTVVATLAETHGAGEGQALAVAILDFPLVLLLQAIPGGGKILYATDSTRPYVFFFSFFGTLMYILAGALLGGLIDYLRAAWHERRRPR